MAKKRKIELKDPDVKPESEAAESHKINNLPDEELRKLALDYVENRIFTSLDCRPEDLQMVFMVVALGAFAGWTREELNDVGLIFEEVGKAGPMACNGNPMFFSCRMLNQHNYKKWADYVHLLTAQRKAFLEHKTEW